jgi:CheY-like chemotaxis protein
MGKKILLADDSITIQKVIELTFSDEDFDVVTVGNGRLAIERLPEVRPDIVLCDIIMPEKDGYEVCQFIKNNPAFAHLPVLLLTGAFEPFDQERAARVGANGHLAKPFEPQTLISKVKELLSANRPVAAAPAVASAPAPAPSKATPVPATAAPPAPPVSAGGGEVINLTRPIPYVTPVPGAPAPAAKASNVREVTFIPDEPFEKSSPAPSAPRPEAAYSAPADDFYGVVEQVDEPVAEFEPEVVQEESPYGGGASVYGGEESFPEVVEEVQPAAAPASSTPWAQSAVEVSWDTGGGAAAGQAPEVFAETPVFDEVYEAASEEVQTPAAAAPARAVSAEPESIPPMLLEYEPVPPAPPMARPAAAPPRATAVPEPSAAEMLEEQAITLDGDDMAAPSVPPAVPVRTVAPAPAPVEEEVSFADVAAGMRPEEDLSRPKGPSVAAELQVPKDMVAQIAQRVVGQMTEKVIREVAWEILPDLAEALIKKEIERLTAELKGT